VRLKQRFDTEHFSSASSHDLKRLVNLELQQLFQNWWAQQTRNEARETLRVTQASHAP
jgi:hypothetical protein